MRVALEARLEQVTLREAALDEERNTFLAFVTQKRDELDLIDAGLRQKELDAARLVSDLMEREATLEREKAEHAMQVASLTSEIARQRRSLEDGAADVDTRRAQFSAELQRLREELSAEHALERASAAKEHEAAVAARDARIERLQQALSKLQRDLGGAGKRLAAADDAIRAVKELVRERTSYRVVEETGGAEDLSAFVARGFASVEERAAAAATDREAEAGARAKAEIDRVNREARTRVSELESALTSLETALADKDRDWRSKVLLRMIFFWPGWRGLAIE